MNEYIKHNKINNTNNQEVVTENATFLDIIEESSLINKNVDDMTNINNSANLEQLNKDITKDDNKKKYIRIICSIIPILIATLLYLRTLENCNLSETACLEQFSITLLKKAIILIGVSAFFFILQLYIFMVIMKNVNFSIISICIIIFITFIYDTGSDFKSHGAYNRFILFIGFLL